VIVFGAILMWILVCAIPVSMSAGVAYFLCKKLLADIEKQRGGQVVISQAESMIKRRVGNPYANLRRDRQDNLVNKYRG